MPATIATKPDVEEPAAEDAAAMGHDAITETVICPPAGWRLINARELWKYRELLYFLTWRDVKVRYKQTLLGAAWAVLQPAMMMVVFTVFFGRLANIPTGGIPYPLFVYAGLLPWTFFATAIANAGNSVVGSERLITKIYFPRLAIPFASVGAALVDFAVAFTLMFVLMVWYRIAPTAQLLLVPVLTAILTLAALGVGTLLAALNVAYRDFRYVIPFLVQLWMFATPSVYMDVNAAVEQKGSRVAASIEAADSRRSSLDHSDPSSDDPPSAREASTLSRLAALNPMTGVIAAFRSAVLGSPVPWSSIGISAASVVLLFAIGCLYFRRVESSFADII
jgi:lipopolysaccharide transport system permease protein